MNSPATLDKIEPGTAAPTAVDWPLRVRLMMVAMGYWPLLHVIASVAAGIFAARARGVAFGFGCSLAIIYVLPPILARLLAIVFPLQPGRHAVSSSAFLRWWGVAQCQVLFNRLPMLEELLRLVPGLYSQWLRLWGAKIGPLVYWTSGLCILDRGWIRVGSRVVFGAGVRINPHLIVPGKSRAAELWIGPVTIGDDALVGGYSLLTAGVTIPSGGVVPAGRFVRPFSTFQNTSALSAMSDLD